MILFDFEQHLTIEYQNVLMFLYVIQLVGKTARNFTVFGVANKIILATNKKLCSPR